ncbi:hypothetical protein Hanom_Chr06g00497201 [Helianthus anomalus]
MVSDDYYDDDEQKRTMRKFSELISDEKKMTMMDKEENIDAGISENEVAAIPRHQIEEMQHVWNL